VRTMSHTRLSNFSFASRNRVIASASKQDQTTVDSQRSNQLQEAHGAERRVNRRAGGPQAPKASSWRIPCLHTKQWSIELNSESKITKAEGNESVGTLTGRAKARERKSDAATGGGGTCGFIIEGTISTPPDLH